MNLRQRSFRPIHRLFVGLFVAGVLVVPTAGSISRAATPVTRTVCIDAGHGGTDPGAIRGPLIEKELTLDIANRLATLLTDNGYNYVMTRTNNDTTLGNTNRANICNTTRSAQGTLADTVLSIHLNTASNTGTDYFKAFYGKQVKDGKFTQKIWDAYNLASATDATQVIQKSSTTNFASGLLLKTNVPATLAETVFLSNLNEQVLLGDGTGMRQQAIAQELYDGLDAWYSQP